MKEKGKHKLLFIACSAPWENNRIETTLYLKVCTFPFNVTALGDKGAFCKRDYLLEYEQEI